MMMLLCEEIFFVCLQIASSSMISICFAHSRFLFGSHTSGGVMFGDAIFVTLELLRCCAHVLFRAAYRLIVCRFL